MNKKIIAILLICTMLISGVYQAQAVKATDINDIIHVIEDKVVIEDHERNYYSTIEMIYSNDVSSKYLVTEYDKTFHIEFLNTGAVLIDNVEYSESDFQEMAIAQDEDLESNKRKRTQLQEFSILDYKNNYRGKINTINYTEINKEIEESALIDHQKCINPKLRCTACGQYSPSSAPTKGYHSFIVGFMERGKLSSFTVLMTSSALGKFATLFCRGVLANATGPMGILVSWVTSGIIDKVCNGDYGLRQTWHDVCPRATREQRKYYVVDKKGNHRYTDIVDDYYYYSSNPY